MKNLRVLLTVFALASFVFFSSCQKEELNNPDQLAAQEEVPVQDRTVACFPIWYFGDYPNCSQSDFTHCDIQFPTSPTDIVGLNQASGTAYVNEAEELVFDLDRVNFDQILEDDIINTQTFTVVEPVEFPQDVVIALYQAAGHEVPEADFGLAAGTYDVELEEVDEPVAERRIKKVITKYNKDGTVRKIKYRYYRN